LREKFHWQSIDKWNTEDPFATSYFIGEQSGVSFANSNRTLKARLGGEPNAKQTRVASSIVIRRVSPAIRKDEISFHITLDHETLLSLCNVT